MRKSRESEKSQEKKSDSKKKKQMSFFAKKRKIKMTIFSNQPMLEISFVCLKVLCVLKVLCMNYLLERIMGKD
ncbi:hypothetical protein CR513_43753, partial [Mucuna pruriens]